jgi:hypothetical protein
MREGVESPVLLEYLDSVFEFAAPYLPSVGGSVGGEALVGLRRARERKGRYPTTEAKVPCYEVGDKVSREEGLQLVLWACDELEAGVARLRGNQADGVPGASALPTE